MIKKNNILFIFILIFLFSFSVKSQTETENKKNYKTGIKYFENEDYAEALTFFLNLDSYNEYGTELKFKIGICYLNSVFERQSAIPYLEYTINDEEYEVQEDIYLDIAKLYHEKYDFDKALLNYNKFLFYAHKDHLYINFTQRMVKVCENAKRLITDSLDVVIENIGMPVNTIFSEFSPFISADGSLLYFNKITYQNKNYLSEGVKKDSLVEIMFSQLINNKWTEPEKINITANFKNPIISLEGITPDGQNLFINIAYGDKSDIYTCTISGNTCTNLTRLNNSINSEYWDGRISQTPDGSELYFSSDRPGGYGGKDIYKMQKDENGEWTDEVINLGPAINTFYDENSPFIHPDKKTLFFSSEGHMAIGGFDIFKSVYENNYWSYSSNIGYPINTTKDELYFVLSANGKSGYFSSSVNNKYENHDIYKVTLLNSIPLTLVKGTIKAGTPPKPIAAKIKVIDKETQQRVKYIYNPNPNTGKYLMIFPPGKNYNMVVEADNYLPQLINIYIPDQTYFYELYQEIILKRVKTLGKVMGEQIAVNNSFYDIYKSKPPDTLAIDYNNRSNESIINKDYSQLLKLIEDIIITTDSVGIDILNEEIDFSNKNAEKTNKTKDYEQLFKLVEKAMNTTDSVSLAILDKNTLYDEKSSQNYFYAERKKDNNLVPIVIDGETIYTKPALNTTNEDMNLPWPKITDQNIPKELLNDSKIDIRNSTAAQRKIIYSSQVFFDRNSAIIMGKFYTELKLISEIIINNDKIGIRLLGYTDSKGKENDNIKLSNNRVTSILEFLIDKGVSNNKAILIGIGESESQNEKNELDMRYNRRVDIEVFEIIK